MTGSGADDLTPTARRIVAGVVVTIAAVCVYAIRQADPDLYGYLAYGRLFLQQGLGSPDPFARLVMQLTNRDLIVAPTERNWRNGRFPVRG